MREAVAELYFHDRSLGDRVFIFENARSAEYLFLKSLGMSAGEEVAVQAFTCNAVINPILWLGLKPLYIDIERDSLNMNPESLSERFTDSCKVIILQHTFGREAKFKEIIDIAHSKGLFVLEDCAHALGVESADLTSGERLLGTFADAAIISFGLEKTLATRTGGALIVNNPYLIEKLREIYAGLNPVSYFDTFLWLVNPLIWQVLRRLGGWTSRVAKFMNRLNLLSLGFYKEELLGIKPQKYPRVLSEALAKFILSELSDLSENLLHRRSISQAYISSFRDSQIQAIQFPNTALPYLRFPVLLENPAMRGYVLSELRKKHFVGDWYDPFIYPQGTDIDKMQYKYGSCTVAEDLSKRIINLPTGKGVTEDLTALIVRDLLQLCKRNGYGET